jgi:hypothetical protein
MRTRLLARTFLMLSTITIMFAVSADAADISGKWTAPATSPSGSSQGDRIFAFKVAGDKVTGTAITQQTVDATFEVSGQPKMVGKLTTTSGSPAEISEGKVTGNDISFVTVAKMGQMEMKTTYKGTVSGNEIKFTATMEMPAGMPMMSGPSSSQAGASSGGSTSSQAGTSSSQGAPSSSQGPQTRSQEFVAKRMNP